MNPLDKPNEQFDFACFNVKPSARKRNGESFYTLTMEIDAELWQLFMDADLKAAIFAGRLFRSQDGEVVNYTATQTDSAGNVTSSNGSVVVKHEHGDVARAIIAYGTFNAPEVLKAIGSDLEFRKWVYTQPSCLTGLFDRDTDKGIDFCIPCHVRRAGAAGTSFKPDYSCVPMRNEEHQHQHQHGEMAALAKFGGFAPGTAIELSEAEAWFDRKVAHYRLTWAKDALARKLGAESLGDVPPNRIAVWAREHDLMRFMPRVISDLKLG